jgi:hypothetical protein
MEVFLAAGICALFRLEAMVWVLVRTGSDLKERLRGGKIFTQLAELKDTWASERSSIQTLDLHLSVASAIRSIQTRP